MITITDEIYKGIVPDTGFVFLLQNGIGVVVLIVALLVWFFGLGGESIIIQKLS